MFDISRYMKYLIQHQLTERQFLFCFCISKAYKEKYIYQLMGDFTKALGHYVDGRKRFMRDEERIDLITRNYVEHTGDGTKASQYSVTEKWMTEFITEYEAGQMLLAKYPPFLIINGTRIPLITSDRFELRKVYYERIYGDRKKHEQAIAALEYGIRNELINMNVEKFIRSEYWDVIIPMMTEKGDLTNKNVVNETEF